MKVVIIDDERLARNELRRLLKAHPEWTLVGEAATMAEGLLLIEQARPDLLLLDIQMPEGSGFDLLSALDDPPMVIFTTAYDQYAIAAFDANALDYLLKPIEPARLAQALGKCQARSAPPPVRLAAGDSKVLIRDGERCWFVALAQIALFESEGNYTRVYLEQSRPMLLRSLNQLEAKLDPAQFLRTSRRHIVNLKFVTATTPGPAGVLTFTLQDDLKVSMSRRRAARFKQDMLL